MEIVKATAGMPIPQAYRVLRGGSLPVYQAMLRSQDAAEGPRAFGEKRAPRWAGR
jgi:crotonobetainyl-CoA hydratase